MESDSNWWSIGNNNQIGNDPIDVLTSAFNAIINICKKESCIDDCDLLEEEYEIDLSREDWLNIFIHMKFGANCKELISKEHRSFITEIIKRSWEEFDCEYQAKFSRNSKDKEKHASLNFVLNIIKS